MCRLSCGRGGQIIENPTSSRTSCDKKFMPTHVEVSSSRPTAAPSNTDHIGEHIQRILRFWRNLTCSPYTNLETAVERGDAADCVGGTPYRIFRRQNVNQASYDRAGACATTTSAGRKETSPLWQRQAPALYLPFAHAFASTAARVRMRPRPRNERRGLGICKPYQGTEYALSAGD